MGEWGGQFHSKSRRGNWDCSTDLVLAIPWYFELFQAVLLAVVDDFPEGRARQVFVRAHRAKIHVLLVELLQVDDYKGIKVRYQRI